MSNKTKTWAGSLCNCPQGSRIENNQLIISIDTRKRRIGCKVRKRIVTEDLGISDPESGYRTRLSASRRLD
jgi:hypothetical protein